jgi:DNA-binding LacI/PurR family transcriptional regulator
MGRQMARLLLARISGEAAGLSVILQTKLVVRESG